MLIRYPSLTVPGVLLDLDERPNQHAPFPEITAPGVARRILMSVHTEQVSRVPEIEADHLIKRCPTASRHCQSP